MQPILEKAKALGLGLTLALGLLSGGTTSAAAAEMEVSLPDLDWSFDGLFGTFDRASLQRGYQVYEQVCASCHSMDLLAYRNLRQIGFTEDEVKAIAAQHTVTDGPDDNGEMFERAAVPSDRMVAPFPNDNAARAANNGALPPDLSVVAKARFGGADYLYALLVGYEEAPGDFQLAPGMHYNAYFPGHAIAMPQPLWGDDVEYADGTEATIDQESRDVAAFLMWAAEPNLEARKQMGVKVILFLLVLTGLLYAVKRKVWADLH